MRLLRRPGATGAPLERARPATTSRSSRGGGDRGRGRDGGSALAAGRAPFRWIGDHVPRWLANAEGHPLVPLARELYASLDVGRATLVHGDFHHHNILRSARGHLAIDPKPMLGEPEYDVPSFLWNPLPYRMRLDVTERRLRAFAAAGLDEERMRRWAVIRGAYLGADARETEVLRELV